MRLKELALAETRGIRDGGFMVDVARENTAGARLAKSILLERRLQQEERKVVLAEAAGVGNDGLAILGIEGRLQVGR